MKYINLNIHSYTENLGGSDPDDSWSRDSTSTDNFIDCEFTISNVEKYNSISIDFDPLPNKDYYLLYVVYTTGDSFGSDSGNLELIDVYEDYDLAKKQEELIDNDYRVNGDRYSIDITLNNGKSVKLSCPWKGYFELLDSVNVQSIRIK